jgi:hypothetical protein|tara:strand:+ start:179 stop:589 length:411 start_codon:yes stop_codon:yes gene_type:complete
MPCNDTTSKITVWLDSDDRLTGCDFTKLTCNRTVGGETGYLEQCTGLSAEEILKIEFQEALDQLNSEDTENQFLLYLEWNALRTSIAQYLGKVEDINQERHHIVSIAHDESGVTITQEIQPPEAMPKIVSCRQRER